MFLDHLETDANKTAVLIVGMGKYVTMSQEFVLLDVLKDSRVNSVIKVSLTYQFNPRMKLH